MTDTDIQHWKELVTRAIDDPDLLQRLLPDTKERAIETAINLSNSVSPGVQALFETAMWHKLAEIYPNDPEVLYSHSISLPRGVHATLEELREFTSFWEHLKEQNDAHNLPLLSPFRKTHGLSQAYIDLGEYEKAIVNIKEQYERIDAMMASGLHHQLMYSGLVHRGAIIELEKLVASQKKSE